MASSDEEGEIVPDSITTYQFLTNTNSQISFSNLPLHFSDHAVVTVAGDGDQPPPEVVYLVGTSDGGLQSVHKQVIGWKFELCYEIPQVYVLSKGKIWIKLGRPNRSYLDVIKSVVIVIHFLHFVKRNLDVVGQRILSHLKRSLSLYEINEPLEKYLCDNVELIRKAVDNDKDLMKSKYLERFLMEIENPGRRETLDEENQMTKKLEFIVDEDDDMESGEDLDEEAEVLYDSVCAFCDNGGDVLPCEGQCLRSFHPTVEAGVDTSCESLGFKAASQYEAIPTFLCNNCKHQKHQCFVCGKLGSSDKSSATEVFPCVSATCGHFYHPDCVAKSLCPLDETLAKKLESRIAAGESFTCPIHKCHRCKGGEDKEVYDLQFAVCRRCPKAYHRKCLPMKIAFEHSADGSVLQRAWDDLLPKRILIYCMKHKMTSSLLTPMRDHLLFPYMVQRRIQDGSGIKMSKVKRSKPFGNLEATETKNMPQMVEKPKSSTMYKERSLFKENVSISRNSKHPSSTAQNKRTFREEHCTTSKPVKEITMFSPPSIDTDTKRRVLRLMKDCTSSFDFDEFIREKKRRCTHQTYTSHTGLDKTITTGKVEASVKAVRTALKKLDDGCSVEDAKAVCEPNILNQLIRWKTRLRVYLAPFLYGARYTSFGRHFTKVEKLKEIVDRLHWYVEDGDMIVDFCCGSNDFSCFMKEKLDSMGKKCSYKNYDLIAPKNTFNYEQRDWFTVPLDALPRGSRLVMGLNPPFGVHASLANKFIDHALKFKPKILILIAPRETKRLDRKRYPYDLIWEEEQMLSGKSFYLPGSINAQDQPLDDWNVVSPPLSLWSHPDWTAKHRAVAENHSHVKQIQHERGRRVVPNYYLMEENHDRYRDLSEYRDTYTTILDDDVPEAPDDGPLPPPPPLPPGCNPTVVLEAPDGGPLPPPPLPLPPPPGANPTHLPEAPAGGPPPAGANPSDDDVPEAPSGGPPPPPVGANPSDSIDEDTNMISDTDIHIQETLPNMCDVDVSSLVTSAPQLEPPFIQPTHPEHYPLIDPPPYANTNDPYDPYASGVGFWYTQSGLDAFPSHYGQSDYVSTSMQPDYAYYAYDYPIFPTYNQPDFTSEPDIWPPGTTPPDRRYG